MWELGVTVLLVYMSWAGLKSMFLQRVFAVLSGRDWCVMLAHIADNCVLRLGMQCYTRITRLGSIRADRCAKSLGDLLGFYCVARDTHNWSYGVIVHSCNQITSFCFPSLTYRRIKYCKWGEMSPRGRL